MNGLSGKIALVTGAASAAGIGFATARALARDGVQVIVTDIDGGAIAARAAELGASVVGLAQDVTSEAAWTDTVAAVAERFGRLDILVNNAGIAILKAMDVMTLADWNRQITVNLTSVYLGCKAAMDQFRRQKSSGAIVNLSSLCGFRGMRGTAAYTASKGGVRLLTKTIALEGAAEGIRCNSVHPGVILTDMQSVALRDNPEQYDIINASIPMGRMGEPDDIAHMIRFLASDDAKYVTGGEFAVDGGLTAQ